MNLNPPSIAGGDAMPEDARPVAYHGTAGQVEIGEVEDVEDYRLSNFVTLSGLRMKSWSNNLSHGWGVVSGHCHFATLFPTLKRLLCHVM